MILLYSYVGDIVLDPFAGIGTTAKVARALGRHFVCYEIHQEYIAFAQLRVGEPLHLRKPLIATFSHLAATGHKQLRLLL